MLIRFYTPHPPPPPPPSTKSTIVQNGWHWFVRFVVHPSCIMRTNFGQIPVIWFKWQFALKLFSIKIVSKCRCDTESRVRVHTSFFYNKRTKMALYWSPDYQIGFESIGFSVEEKKFNKDFQDGGHLGFPIRKIIATFDLQVTSILPMKFHVNWRFDSV